MRLFLTGRLDNQETNKDIKTRERGNRNIGILLKNDIRASSKGNTKERILSVNIELYASDGPLLLNEIQIYVK